MPNSLRLLAALAAATILSAATAQAAAPHPGQPAPDFTLTDANGKKHALADFKGKHVVLEWTNAECPFVKKHYSSGNMQKTQQAAAGKGVVWLAINSSAPGKQGALTAESAKDLAKKDYSNTTALLLDSDGTVGKLYGAKTTPQMFLINPEGTLVYAGAIDSISSADVGDIAKATNYVQTALDESLAGQPVKSAATKSYGCSVKY